MRAASTRSPRWRSTAAWISATSCSPSKSDTTSSSPSGSMTTDDVYPAGSRSARYRSPSCSTGKASMPRSRGPRDVPERDRVVMVRPGSCFEIRERGGDVDTRRVHQLGNVDVLVHLMRNEPMAGATCDDRDPELGPQDRAVGGARHAAPARGPSRRAADRHDHRANERLGALDLRRHAKAV